MDTIAPFRITVCGIEELTDHPETGASHVLSILVLHRPNHQHARSPQAPAEPGAF